MGRGNRSGGSPRESVLHPGKLVGGPDSDRADHSGCPCRQGVLGDGERHQHHRFRNQGRVMNSYQGRGDGRFDFPLWTDLRMPSQGINPPGAASDPGVDDDTGLLVFSGLLDNVIVGAAQMPHEWKPGSTVKPHIHLRFPTSATANTRWSLAYDIANNNGDFTNASGTYTALATVTVANPENVNRLVPAAL